MDIETREFEEKVVAIDRVARVVKGGRRFRFRATVVVGDKKGRVGVGIGKGGDVQSSIQKAVQRAKKSMIEVALRDTTIPHETEVRFGGAKVMLKPASEGTGVIAGGAVRAVVEAAGIKDVLSKSFGSSNKINNIYATFIALSELRGTPSVSQLIKQAENKLTKTAKAESRIKNQESSVDEEKAGKKESAKKVAANAEKASAKKAVKKTTAKVADKKPAAKKVTAKKAVK